MQIAIVRHWCSVECKISKERRKSRKKFIVYIWKRGTVCCWIVCLCRARNVFVSAAKCSIVCYTVEYIYSTLTGWMSTLRTDRNEPNLNAAAAFEWGKKWWKQIDNVNWQIKSKQIVSCVLMAQTRTQELQLCGSCKVFKSNRHKCKLSLWKSLNCLAKRQSVPTHHSPTAQLTEYHQYILYLHFLWPGPWKE